MDSKVFLALHVVCLIDSCLSIDRILWIKDVHVCTHSKSGEKCNKTWELEEGKRIDWLLFTNLRFTYSNWSYKCVQKCTILYQISCCSQFICTQLPWKYMKNNDCCELLPWSRTNKSLSSYPLSWDYTTALRHSNFKLLISQKLNQCL